jgi:hypothetical protein
MKRRIEYPALVLALRSHVSLAAWLHDRIPQRLERTNDKL